MLTKLDVSGLDSGSLSIPLGASQTGIVIKDITGIGPIKASMVSNQLAGIPGAQFQASNIGTRNIVITLELRPSPSATVTDLVSQVYSAFWIGGEITLLFSSNKREDLKIVCRVESVDIPRFAKTSIATISLIAFEEPYFSANGVTRNGATVGANTLVTINYAGTAPIGFTIDLTTAGKTFANANAANNNITITSNRQYDGAEQKFSWTYKTAIPVTNGSRISFNSNERFKGVELLSGTTNVVGALTYVDRYSTWLMLLPGQNVLTFKTPFTNLAMQYSYINKYLEVL